MQALINKWRDQYEFIYVVSLCDTEFVFRELTTEEFSKAKRYYPDDMEREEYVCALCVIYPIGYDFEELAGIPTTLTRLILDESGFDGSFAKGLFNHYRSEMQQFENQVDAIICSAFNIQELEMVEKWTIRKKVKYLSRAEWMLSNIQGLPFSITDQPVVEEIDYDLFPEARPMRGKQ